MPDDLDFNKRLDPILCSDGYTVERVFGRESEAIAGKRYWFRTTITHLLHPTQWTFTEYCSDFFGIRKVDVTPEQIQAIFEQRGRLLDWTARNHRDQLPERFHRMAAIETLQSLEIMQGNAETLRQAAREMIGKLDQRSAGLSEGGVLFEED